MGCLESSREAAGDTAAQHKDVLFVPAMKLCMNSQHVAFPSKKSGWTTMAVYCLGGFS